MKELCANQRLSELLSRFDSIGGILDYVILEPNNALPREAIHREAALAAIPIIEQRRNAALAAIILTDQRLRDIRAVHRLSCEESRITGHPISFSQFWGSDEAWLQRSTTYPEQCWIPEVDGYKTAFFLPPYDLSDARQECETLFQTINEELFGTNYDQLEIFQ